MKTIIRTNTTYYRGVCERCHTEFVCEKEDTIKNSAMRKTIRGAHCPKCNVITDVRIITEETYKNLINDVAGK